MAKRNVKDYPEILAIIQRLKGGRPHEMIMAFVPSHDRKEKPLGDATQQVWAERTLGLFGKLFTGATAFRHLDGVYQPRKDMRPLFDKLILVQSLSATEHVENEENLFELSDFCREMGAQMNQMSIGLVLNNYFIDIPISHA